MDKMLAAYVKCALWSSTDNADDSGGEPLDENYGAADLAPGVLAKMQADCDAFEDKAADFFDLSYDVEQAGHDFWLTRNGHGAGFWDGDWPEPAASKLTALAKSFGQCDLYVGDDGKLYLS